MTLNDFENHNACVMKDTQNAFCLRFYSKRSISSRMHEARNSGNMDGSITKGACATQPFFNVGERFFSIL